MTPRIGRWKACCQEKSPMYLLTSYERVRSQRTLTVLTFPNSRADPGTS